MFDNPHEIIGLKTVKSAQDPFEFKNHGQWYEYLMGFGQKTMGDRTLLRCFWVSRVIHIKTRQDIGIKGDHLLHGKNILAQSITPATVLLQSEVGCSIFRES